MWCFLSFMFLSNERKGCRGGYRMNFEISDMAWIRQTSAFFFFPVTYITCCVSFFALAARKHRVHIGSSAVNIPHLVLGTKICPLFLNVF